MKTFFISILSIYCYSSIAQTTMSGDLQSHVESIISGLPGSDDDDYTEPLLAEISDWNTLLGNLFSGNYATANTQANALDYDLIEFTDSGNSLVYYILEPSSGSTNYWGTYVLNPAACRSELVIMSVHPRKDLNTGKQGIYCFIQTDAYFYMLSGTNRCNSLTNSTCSGTTTVCSNADPAVSEDYRISDLAHATASIWQTTTEYVHDNVAGTYFVQLHGFTKKSTDPYVIMSNGTRQTPNPDKIVELQNELLQVDATLTFEVAHVNLSWTRLIGFTNTNGRYINSSADACSTNATTTLGRFLHIEQEKTKLRDDQSGWHKMAVALGETFNANACASLLPLKLVDFSAQNIDKKIELSWETAWERNVKHFEIQHSLDGKSFSSIATVNAAANASFSTIYTWSEKFSAGNHYFRLKMIDKDWTYQFSPVINVNSLDSERPFTVSSSQIFINETTSGAFTLNIFDALGRTINSVQLNEGNTFEFNNLPKGIYFYKVEQGNQIWSGKFWSP